MKDTPYYSRPALLVILFLLLSGLSIARTVVLPLTFDDTGLPLLRLDIGEKNQQFILDLGSAEGLHLSKAMMQKVSGLQLKPEPARSIDLAGKVQLNDSFVIPSLNIGTLHLEQVSGVELQPWGLSFSSDPNNSGPPSNIFSAQREGLPVIGRGLFRQHRVVLDFKRRFLSLSDEAADPEELLRNGWLPLPWRFSDEGLMITAQAQGRSYQMALDSAATHSIIKAKRLAKKSQLIRCGELYGEKGKADRCRQLRLKPSIGTQRTILKAFVLNDLPEAFAADGVAGADFFQQFAVMFDLARQQLWVQPVVE